MDLWVQSARELEGSNEHVLWGWMQDDVPPLLALARSVRRVRELGNA